MMRAYVDIETCSRADLVKYGVHRYVNDDLFEIMSAVASVDGHLILYVNPKCGGFFKLPRSLSKYYRAHHQNFSSYIKTFYKDKNYEGCFCIVETISNFFSVINAFSCDKIVAHNAEFEYICLAKKEPRFSRFEFLCTQSRAAAAGLPESLKDLSSFLGLGEKLSVGKDLINIYSCLPSTASEVKKFTKEDYAELIDYNVRDVELLKLVDACLPDLNDGNRYSNLTYRMNERGLPVDIDLVKKVVTTVAEQANALSKSVPVNVRSPKQLCDYLATLGFDVPDAKNATILKLYEQLNTGPYAQGVDALAVKKAKAAIEARQQVALSSVSKFNTALEQNESGRLRGMFKYYGTLTGRDAGRKIQPQNLPRGSLIGAQTLDKIDQPIYPLLSGFNVFKGAKEGLRGMFRTSPDKTFFCADFAGIELRVLMWLAQEEEALNVIRQGEDLYITFAAKIFGKAAKEVTKKKRALGKAAVLGLGYSMGTSRFVNTCELQHRLQVSNEEALHIVQLYRTTFANVPRLWRTCEDRLRYAESLSEQTGRLAFHPLFNDFTAIRLPSGRDLLYYHLRNVEGKLEYLRFSRMKNIDEPEKYMNINHTWFKREKLYGGKIVENIVQAIARDIFFDACDKLEKAGFDIVARVHDEVLCEIPREAAEAKLAEGINLMETCTLSWAEGLPLKVEGWIDDFYHK
jgi:DNA polymerase